MEESGGKVGVLARADAMVRAVGAGRRGGRTVACALAVLGTLLGAGTAAAAPYVYATNGLSNELSVFRGAGASLEPALQTWSAPTGAAPIAVAVTPSGRNVYVANVNDNPTTISQFTVDATGGLVPVAPAKVTAPGLSYESGALAVSRDGKGLYAAANSGSSGGVLQFDVDPATGALTPKTPAQAAGHTPDTVAVSADGKTLYTANFNGGADGFGSVTAYAIDPSGGALSEVSTTSTNPAGSPERGQPRGLSVSADGHNLYAALPNVGTIAHFSIDPATGVLGTPTSLSVGGNNPGVLAISPDGRSLYAGDQGGRLLQLTIDATTGELTPKSPASLSTGTANTTVGAITLTPDGSRLYVAVGNRPDPGILEFAVDPATGRLSPATPSQVITPGNGGLAVSADGASVFATEYARRVTRYAVDPATGQLSTRGLPRAGTFPIGLAATPLGTDLYVVNYQGDTVSQFDVDPGTGVPSAKTPATVATGRGPLAVAVAADGTHAYVVNNTGASISQYVIDPPTGLLTPLTPATVTTGPGPWGLALTPDGRYAYATSLQGGTLWQYGVDAQSGALTPLNPATLALGGNPTGVAVSADGQNLYAANSADATVSEFSINAATGALTALTPAKVSTGAGPQSVAVSPTGGNVYVPGSSDATLSQYTRNPATGVLTRMAPATVATAPSPFGVSVSPDGASVYVAGTQDGTVSQYAADPVSGALTPKTPAKVAAGSGSVYGVLAIDPIHDANPPAVFALAAPADGAIVTARPTLDWSGSSDAESGLGHYEVYVDGTALASHVSPRVTRFSPPADLADGTHSWFVRAVDRSGNQTDTATRTFTVDAAPPLAFALLNPSDGAPVTTRPLFTWAAATDDPAGVEHYEVLVDGTQLQGDVAGTSPSPALTTAADLTPGRHTWQVRAVDGVGNVRTSATRAFVVISPPKARVSASDALVVTGQTVSFSAATSTPPAAGSIAGYRWDLDGDGTFETDTGTDPTVTHAYAEPGTVAPAVQVTSGFGTTDAASVAIDVRRASPAGTLGVTINHGAASTTDPHVTISAAWPLYATTMSVSNDGGFAHAQDFPVGQDIPWILESSGADRLPKTVYVRFSGGQATRETYQDDIVLDQVPPAVNTVGAPVSAGDSVATNTQATPDDPTGTRVTTPVAGTVTIREGTISEQAPPGYTFAGQQVNIEAPAATASLPLRLVFRLDASELPIGTDASSLVVFRNGVPIDPCTDPTGQALPDPCVAARETLADGDAQLTILTSHASRWNFAAPPTVLSPAAAGAAVVRLGGLAPLFAPFDVRLPPGKHHGRLIGTVRNPRAGATLTAAWFVNDGKCYCAVRQRRVASMTKTGLPAGLVHFRLVLPALEQRLLRIRGRLPVNLVVTLSAPGFTAREASTAMFLKR